MRDAPRWILATLLMIDLAPSEPRAQTFTGMGLGSRIVTTFFVPISGDGSVAVGWIDEAGGMEAFRWTADGGAVRIGFLPQPAGTETTSAAAAVSSDGSTVVGSSNGQAFRWTESQGMVGLGFLPPRDGARTESTALAVSADGSTVVGTSNGEAYRWAQQSGMVGLGFFGCCNDPRSSAFFVSVDGSVVGGMWNVDLSGGAYRWTQAQGMQSLGSLAGALSTIPRDMSSDGSAVVAV